MLAKGVKPTIVTANSVLHLYCRKDMADEAALFFEQMESKYGVVRDEMSYLEIIRLFAARDDVERTRDYLRRMKEVGEYVNECEGSSINVFSIGRVGADTADLHGRHVLLRQEWQE